MVYLATQQKTACSYDISNVITSTTHQITATCRATDMHHLGSSGNIWGLKLCWKDSSTTYCSTGGAVDAVLSDGEWHTLTSPVWNPSVSTEVDQFVFSSWVAAQNYWQCDYNDTACTEFRYAIECKNVYFDDELIYTQPPTDHCPDGTEVISDPVYLMAGENWASDVISTEWDYIQARYTISNANEPAGRVLAGLATLNGKDWLWGPESNASIVSVTIPSSIGYDEDPNGPDVELGVRNTYDPFYLVSACIVPYSQTMVPSDCNLVNHSFTEDLPGWSTLVYDYLSSEEDGAISLDGGGTGLASQVVTLTGSFRMEVRARSGGTSSEFRFGGYELGWPFESQAFTETATSEYQIFNGYLYLDGRSNISLVSNDDDLIVDWVCLSGHDTSGLPWKFPIPDCEFPTFDDHPEYSITEIGNWIDWLAQKTGELLKWVVCQMFVALFTIANMILEAIRAIGGFVGSPDWPTLPDEITFDSILEWLRQVYVAFFNWLGLNFNRFRDAIPTIAEWWWNVVLGVIGWIIDSLIGPIFGWLLDQLLATLGIGEDAREAFMVLWRDAGIFLQAAWIEAGYEFDSLTTLLSETTGVFGVLITGLRGVATGETELDFGESLGGLAGYLWRGVEFINETITFTPLSALNIVALGIITIGLAQWTVKKFVGMLERFS
jgi:hypothetical protein